MNVPEPILKTDLVARWSFDAPCPEHLFGAWAEANGSFGNPTGVLVAYRDWRAGETAVDRVLV